MWVDFVRVQRLATSAAFARLYLIYVLILVAFNILILRGKAQEAAYAELPGEPRVDYTGIEYVLSLLAIQSNKGTAQTEQ